MIINAPLAHQVEHVTFNDRVAGSSPARRTNLIMNEKYNILNYIGWMEEPRPRYSLTTLFSHGVSKVKKRARKAQRQARRRNRK